MAILTSIFLIAGASTLAMYINDRFDLGGYLEE